MTRPPAPTKRPAGQGKQINFEIFRQVCRTFRLPEPQPEYCFHAERKWRIDFYFEANGRRLALEVEGGVFTGGRHTRGAGFVADIEKYNELSAAGIFLVRVTPDGLMKVETMELVKRVLYG